MKFSKIFYTSFFGASLLAGCNKSDFVKLNTNPNVLYTIKPEEQYLNACIRAHNNDRIAFYDNYRRIMPWMQMSTFNTGNGKNFLMDVGNFNQRYNTFYPQLGAILTDVQVLIDNLPAEEQAKRVHMRAIPDILKIYYAFHVSDINGSIPYTEAFQARYGGTLTPKYETQQELFALWDTRLKEIINTLKSTPSVPQASFGENDLYYHGNVNAWIKAANALRLKIAIRLMKRDEAKLKSIAQEVLSDASSLMNSNNDGWVFYADASFTQGGDWNPSEFRAPKPTVDFMWNNSDPRLRLFYQKNNYTEANLKAAIQAGVYPAGTSWNPRQYVGAHISPDSSQGKYKSWFVLKKVSETLSMDTVSFLQWRMFQPALNNGTGKNFFPVISYADFCFMRAELAARGITSEDAATLYNKGIDASISFYDLAAKNAKLPDYEAVTIEEINAYKLKPAVIYNSSKAIEQIAIQAYLNFYKQPNEAWALYKRTGMPNKNTTLANEDIVIDAAVKQIPRRAALGFPDPNDQNYNNKKAAIDAMVADPDFGQGPTDMFGRVWWDKK